MIFIEVISAVYLVAVNVYGFILIYRQKRAEDEGSACEVKDGKVFFTGFIGGAVGVYVAMFIYKYRLTSLSLMVFMPVFIATTVFAAIGVYFYALPNLPLNV